MAPFQAGLGFELEHPNDAAGPGTFVSQAYLRFDEQGMVAMQRTPPAVWCVTLRRSPPCAR
jgi:hypothetical protein